MTESVRSNWSRDQVKELFTSPLLELVYRAASLHRSFHPPSEVQICTLLSVKTGACPEDCAYCPQSAHHTTSVEKHKLLPLADVMLAAKAAKQSGATRFCMGAAWREVKENKDFEDVLQMVREVHGLGLEVCCTLGMLTADQAIRLKEAGVYAYNHNLDSSEEFYKKIISTRTYQDRLRTLQNVRNAGMTICCGGIIGMGESDDDRVDLLHTLATLTPHPESVPINSLVPVPGTPLEHCAPVAPFELIRMIAVARILMPQAMVRLSAGRLELSKESQALAFLAGANSIFAGEKLLTTPNPEVDEDRALFESLGLVARPQ